MPCFLTLVPISRPLVPGGMTNAAWPRAPSSGSTEATTTCTAAMPPFVAQAFWPLSTHSSLASSYFARVRSDDTSEPASGSETQKAPTFGSSSRAVALRHPLEQLLGRARGEDPGHGERRAHDRHADAGVAPEQLLVHDREGEAGLVGPELGDALEAVEPDLGRLLDHRPGGLLALVPLRGGRAHHVLGEAVNPVADVLLVVGELEREGGGGLRLCTGGGGHGSPILGCRSKDPASCPYDSAPGVHNRIAETRRFVTTFSRTAGRPCPRVWGRCCGRGWPAPPTR